MKKLIITVFIIFCHVHFSDTALTEVSLGKYSCLYIDTSGAKTDKGFYLQISPESLNMVERNSKLRKKNHGYADIIAFNTWSEGDVSAELVYSFDIKVIQNRYYINRDSAKFPHKFTMDRKTYLLNIEDIYSRETLNYQCKQLNNNLSFEDLILERIFELQELKNLKQ